MTIPAPPVRTAPQIPGAVQVGAAIFTVKVSKRIDYDKNGSTENDKSVILLARKISESIRRDVLVHELLHALLWQHGINHALKWSSDKEERTVKLLAPALLSLIRDNPDLVTYLNSDD